MSNLLDRLKSAIPKRILTLDGGGVRGVLSLGFLAKIESVLCERYGQPDFRLCDYFDLISGTSTGAIIATGLAIGMSVDDIAQQYRNLTQRVFGRRRWNPWKAIYDERPLAEQLHFVFGEKTLADDSLRTGLCLILKRADTNSLWPLNNHPEGRFFEANRSIRLCDAVRASTAAPTLFLPKFIHVGNQEQAAFVDGAVSMANNPAWQTFLVATLQGYPFRWRTGENHLLLTSVGTGRRVWNIPVVNLGKYWLLNWAQEIPRMLIDDASLQVQMTLQGLSNSPTAISIDSEIGDLRCDSISANPLLHYLRYDQELTTSAFSELGYAVPLKLAQRLASLSAVDLVPLFAAVGDAAAKMQVKPEHFPPEFDVA